MTFTYLGTLGTDLDKVRFHIGDTTSGSGVKPADANFSDAELNGLVTLEGSWQRAVAGAFEVLAAAWARHATFNAGGVSSSQSDIARSYRESAAEWRRRYGTSSTHAAGSAAVTRADAYSSDLDATTTSDDADDLMSGYVDHYFG